MGGVVKRDVYMLLICVQAGPLGEGQWEGLSNCNLHMLYREDPQIRNYKGLLITGTMFIFTFFQILT